MDDEEVRRIVAEMLLETGHGNQLFVQSIREGGQDDGPFMRAAKAVRDAYHKMIFSTAPVAEDSE